jgi:hypothetical protein
MEERLCGSTKDGTEISLKRTWARLGALIAAFTLTASAAMPGTASAYVGTPTPTGVCGSAYTVNASLSLGGGAATVYLLRNGASICVVTIKNASALGNSVRIRASVWLPGYEESFDEGIADRVYLYESSDGCVNWGGAYGSSARFVYC